MIVVTAGVALVLAAMAFLILQTWWALAIPLAAHALATICVVVFALGRAGQTGGKPDPVTEAREEEERRDLEERRRRTGQINPARDYEVF
jgi:hypothetical protein